VPNPSDMLEGEKHGYLLDGTLSNPTHQEKRDAIHLFPRRR
jgi:hypothetical protein